MWELAYLAHRVVLHGVRTKYSSPSASYEPTCFGMIYSDWVGSFLDGGGRFLFKRLQEFSVLPP